MTQSIKAIPPIAYSGPGIWITGIKHRYGARRMEWFSAAQLTIWGWVLTYNDHLFEQPSFAGFRTLFGSEAPFGWFMVFLGLLRIGGLIVNGARKHVTPVIRQISAALGCLIWIGLTYCYASSGVISTWLAVYPLWVLAELDNIYRAAHDQGEARRDTRRAI